VLIYNALTRFDYQTRGGGAEEIFNMGSQLRILDLILMPSRGFFIRWSTYKTIHSSNNGTKPPSS
jgi:hypothetical protein